MSNLKEFINQFISELDIRQTMQNVMELDSALADLQQRSSMTALELEHFYSSASSIAKQTGLSTQEILKQAAALAGLGHYSADALRQMTEYSARLSAISPGLDPDSAASGLASITKAFGLETDRAVSGVLSKINAVGSGRDLANSDITDFLTRSASSLAASGSSLEETIALGSAALEATGNAAQAGEALNAVSARIQNCDGELGTCTGDLALFQDKLTELSKTADSPDGIRLFLDGTQDSCKSAYQLLEEVSGIWDGLADENKVPLLETIGGSGNIQPLAAIVSNFDGVREAMGLMADSAGSADAAMTAVMDTLQYKAGALSQTGTAISQNLFHGEDMNAVLDVLTGAGEAVSYLTDKLGLFGSVGLGAGISGITKFVKNMDKSDFRITITDSPAVFIGQS